MTQGSGGIPGQFGTMPPMGQTQSPALPMVPMAANGPIQTDVSSRNIFDLIKQGYSQSLTAALPFAQRQMGAKSAAAEPQIAGMKRTGEEMAMSAQSDALKRGMTGSDIESGAMFGARNEAAQKEAVFRSQLAMQEAQFMAEQVMSAYQFDIGQNTQLYNNLAQAIGQELVQQREMEMAEKQLALQKKAMKANSKMGMWQSIIGAVGTIGGAMVGAPQLGSIASQAYGATQQPSGSFNMTENPSPINARYNAGNQDYSSPNSWGLQIPQYKPTFDMQANVSEGQLGNYYRTGG